MAQRKVASSLLLTGLVGFALIHWGGGSKRNAKRNAFC